MYMATTSFIPAERQKKILKRCTCGREYTTEEWNNLLFVGPVDVEEDDDGLGEVRQCGGCFSTIAVDSRKKAVSHV